MAKGNSELVQKYPNYNDWVHRCATCGASGASAADIHSPFLCKEHAKKEK